MASSMQNHIAHSLLPLPLCTLRPPRVALACCMCHLTVPSSPHKLLCCCAPHHCMGHLTLPLSPHMPRCHAPHSRTHHFAMPIAATRTTHLTILITATCTTHLTILISATHATYLVTTTTTTA